MNQSEAKIKSVLSDIYGFDGFRPHQEGIVQALMNRRDAVAVMPTGGGKSLCYQLPAQILSGTGVIISPLISLMKDQVDAARANGIRAEYLNSSQGLRAMAEVHNALSNRELDLLYIAPERFVMDRFRTVLKSIPLSLFAIDEAHCISEWGHDFRQDYLALSLIRNEFPDIPVAAFTATATPPVQNDIIRRLELRDPYLVRASFNRPNLFYQVEPKCCVELQICEWVKRQGRNAGIVYRTTRDDVESTARWLQDCGIDALPYHAGLSTELRQEHQEKFNRDQIQVMVATIAFGMGIDKPNVRFVLHGDLPKNIESYYQETGRAGRDGRPAHCLLFYAGNDTVRIRYFIDKIKDRKAQEYALTKLQQMSDYARNKICRRRQLLAYFGESTAAHNCQSCDICVTNKRHPPVSTGWRK